MRWRIYRDGPPDSPQSWIVQVLSREERVVGRRRSKKGESTTVVGEPTSLLLNPK